MTAYTRLSSTYRPSDTSTSPNPASRLAKTRNGCQGCFSGSRGVASRALRARTPWRDGSTSRKSAQITSARAGRTAGPRLGRGPLRELRAPLDLADVGGLEALGPL